MKLEDHDIYMNLEPVGVPNNLLKKIDDIIGQYPTLDAMSATFPFRAFAASNIPNLFYLAETIRKRLEGEQQVVVIKLALAELEPSVTRFLLLVLASCIGIPTQTDPTDQKVIWEVTPRRDHPLNHKPTISETNYEADFHTDSAYRVMPERYVALLCIQSARDGGLTTLLDANSVLFSLRSLSEGMHCEKILRTPIFPFRVPDSFTKSENASEVINVPILANIPFLRYRHDSILDGIQGTDVENIENLYWALEILRRAMALCKFSTISLSEGDLIFMNNHTILHGRTAFADPNRLLLRVRMDSDPSLSTLD